MDLLAPAEVGAVLEGLAEEPDPETLAEAAALELEPEAEGVAVGVTDGVPLKVTPCKSHEDASAKGFFSFHDVLSKEERKETYDGLAELTSDSFGCLDVGCIAGADDTLGGACNEVLVLAQTAEVTGVAGTDICVGDAWVGASCGEQQQQQKHDKLHSIRQRQR